ncbi:MAG: hypothetical protein NZ902_01385 [Acidilobaceae archaeon]|nr:hypothetical protein [Acidilobaceae archaeon]MDW7973903.1 hypothetical protein [Sulfolobales archaeon]
MPSLRYLPLTLAVLAVILLSRLSLVELRTEEGHVRRVLVTCDAPVVLEFNNSLTRSLVRLKFKACGGLWAEGIETDPGTLEYYSGGFWDVNESARSFRAERLRFCSADEFIVRVGEVTKRTWETCIEISAVNFVDILSGLLPIPREE